MEFLIFISIIFGIWIVYSAISFLVEIIGQKVRDKAAKKVFSQTSINFEKDERDIDIKMSQVECSDWKDIPWVNGQPLLNHGLERCPMCKKGYLIEREGEYGIFMGCTSYPECTHTESSNEQEKDILYKMREAYK